MPRFQVEAALESEPDNEELKRLKFDLEEVIKLEEELLKDTASSASRQQSKVESASDIASSPSSSVPKKEPITWKVGSNSDWKLLSIISLVLKVGDQCKAPSANGQKFLAVIDGFTQESAAVTFVGKGTKHMVKTCELSPVRDEENKKYVWDKTAKSLHHRKSEWQMERERRRLRALKKEHRKKELEEAKEDEKNKWLSFNAKASSRSMKGFKRPTASGSAPDGPKWGITTQTSISSRRDLGAFKSTQRGNMDSLF
ncbi:unnamed protein product [Anisakis simplex]|uniref:Survival of motor neuron-related-splicing factor 30 (inferred by orthology to a human protein) n=1 Tax=Anisakis simplex TaxID=6269 RepID=A0A0M3JUF5_ANISI|nr:unnamed protein product [Anisakis simplex]